MVRKAIIAASCFSLSACGSGSDKADKIDLTILRNKVEALETRIARAEMAAVSDYATFKPTEKSWSWIEWRGILLRVGVAKVEKQGNGSRLTLSIVNPQAVTLKDCTLGISWAESDQAGNVVQSTMHDETMDIDADFPGGGFAVPSVDLADIPPERLGHIAIARPYCTRTST